MERTRAYRRDIRKRKCLSKMHKNTQDSSTPWYDCFGKYDKGKIHCSCGMCTFKVKNYGYTAADKRKLEKMEENMVDIV